MKFKYIISQFIKFGLVGVSTTLISYGLYSLLVYIGVPYLISNIIAFVIGTLNSFLWNSIFVFKKDVSEKRNPLLVLLKTFLTYGSTNLALNSLLLFILVEKLNCSEYIAPIVILFITVPLNFFINKFWAYKTTKKECSYYE